MPNSPDYTTVRLKRVIHHEVQEWARAYGMTVGDALGALVTRALRLESQEPTGEIIDHGRAEREAASAAAKARRVPTPIPAPIVEGLANGHLSELSAAIGLLTEAVERIKTRHAPEANGHGSGFRAKVG